MFRKPLLALAFVLSTIPAQAQFAWGQNTTCSDRPSTDSSNACANTRFVQGQILAPTTPAALVPIELVGGGTGKTSAQNSAAVTLAQTTYATASPNQGVRIVLGPGTYNFLCPTNVTKDAVTFRGAGKGITNMKFNPTADGVCLNFENANNEINYAGIYGASVTSTDTTFKKTMINIVSATGFILDDVLIGQQAFGVGLITGGGTGGSIGMRIYGHQFMKVRSLDISADQPIIVSKNPINYISADYFDFRRVGLLGNNASPLVQYEAGVTKYQNIWDDVSLVKGTDGFNFSSSVVYNNLVITAGGSGYTTGDTLTVVGGTCTTQPQIRVAIASAGAVIAAGISNVGVCTVLPGPAVTVTGGTGTGATFTLSTQADENGVTFWNIRSEQGAVATGYSFNLQSPTAGIQAITIGGGTLLDGGRKGIIFRNTKGISLDTLTATATVDALNVDSTVEALSGNNVQFRGSATVPNAFTGQNVIWAVDNPTGYVFPPNFAFSSTIFSLRALSINGGSLAASSLTLRSTTSGAPAGDILNLIGSTVAVTGALTGSSTGVFTTSLQAPVWKSAAAFQFQTNGSTFAGNIDTSQRWLLGKNTTFGSVPSVLALNANTSATIPSIGSTPIFSAAAADESTPQFSLHAFASGSAFIAPLYSGFRARGTAASPTAAASGDVLTSLFGYGYYTSGGPAYGTGAGGGLFIFATENYDSTHLGSRIDFYTTALAGTSSAQRVSIANGLSIGSTTDPGTGALSTTTFASIGTKIRAAGSAPTLTAGCNGAGSSVSGSDLAGLVTGQTAAATTCTLTFNVAYAAAPYCVATGVTSPLTGTTATTTTTLVVNFASTANYQFQYACFARSGG